MFIEEVMAEVNNYFEAGAPISGKYTIENGSCELPFLAIGQYFRVQGSLFNDGVYIYPAQLNQDETFTGYITPLAPPKAFVELSERIGEYRESAAGVGPYTSESFGGYSYTKAAGAGGGGLTWQEAHRVELRRWRKI